MDNGCQIWKCVKGGYGFVEGQSTPNISIFDIFYHRMT